MGYVYRQGRRPQTTSPISYRAADGFLICSLCGRKTKAKNYPMGNEDFNHDPGCAGSRMKNDGIFHAMV